MEFFNSLLHALDALALGILLWLSAALGSLGSNVVVQTAPLPSAQQVSTSSPAPAPAATTTKQATPAPPKKPAAPATQPAPAPTPAQPPPAAPAVTVTNDLIAQVNTQTRASLVNLLCSFRTAHTSSYISGSGVVIDPRGIILTNAHVAQFFLLQNYSGTESASCTVRAGSPAAPAYSATLLYLPPAWIVDNAAQILSDHAMGTGERDYAFLYITGAAQSAPALPPSFVALSLSTASPSQNNPVLLAAYPAGFLDATGVQRSLYISSAVSAIQQLYTFDSPTHTDLVSLGGTVVSQGGSSGGAVINLADGKLTGLISTESEGTTTASRDLRAITLDYINRSLAEDGKGGISALLANDPSKTAQDFNAKVVPALAQDLVAAIEKQFQ